MAEMDKWRIELLGGLMARRGNVCLSRFRSHQTGALLASLAYHPQAQGREAQIEMLWPDCDPAAGRNRLSVALSSLRAALEDDGPEIIVADRQHIGLNRARIETDVADFHAALQAAAPLETEAQIAPLSRAVELYRGRLLPGYYEDWVAPEERRLEELFFRALRRLIIACKKSGDWQRALAWAEHGVAVGPEREEAHRDLMVLLASRGQHAAALRQGRELEHILRERDGSAPTAATRALMREIEQAAQTLVAARPRLAAPTPEAPPADTIPDTLPLPMTRFFGRESELNGLKPLLHDPQVRLVTLTGTGGGGKTRLSIEAARQTAASFEGGAWWVPLADLFDADLLAEALRDALHLTPQPNVLPLDAVVAALSARPVLLVLDNFEQLGPDGSRVVGALLKRVPSLRVLVTSRQRLNLPGEREWLVPPLAMPDESRPEPLESLADYAAIALFCDRASAVRSGFVLNEVNARCVAQLCRRLDGVPLAIELAAARSGVLTPCEIVAHLDERLDLLVSHQHDIAPRHRTLRAAIEWSFRLLSPELQQFWTRLSVFRGGCTFEAARAVCDEKAALNALEMLREASLLVSEDGAPAMRFRLLETLREFAGEQLPLPERERARHLHARYFFKIAEDSEPGLMGPDQAQWLARLDAELDNLRAALAWAVESDPALALRLSVKLSSYWECRGHLAEGVGWLSAVLRQDAIETPDEAPLLESGLAATPDFWRGRACTEAGRLAWMRGDYQAARTFLEESITIFRTRDDVIGLAWALDYLGLVLSRQDEAAQARGLHEQSLAIGREHGYRELIVNALSGLVNVAVATGDIALLRAVAPEKLALQRELSNRRGEAFALFDMAILELTQGSVARSNALAEESLSIFRSQAEPLGLGMALGLLGVTRRLTGQTTLARQATREALLVMRQVGDTWALLGLIEQFAYLDLAQAEPQRAARLLGAAESARERLHSPRPVLGEADHAMQIELLRARMEPNELSRLWAQGRGLTLDGAVELALQG